MNQRIHQINQAQAIEQISAYIRDCPEEKAPFALVLGSGFSYGLVPLAREIVMEIAPLWICANREKIPYQVMADRPRHERAERIKSFWTEFLKKNKDKGDFSLVLDQSGFPKDYGDAYTALFHSRFSSGLHTPALARRFQREFMQSDQLQLNQSHFLLASILGSQPAKSRGITKYKYRTAFCDLILTTNFDPYLQIALQLVNQLYIMNDTPDLAGKLDDEDALKQAVELVYVHGSVHRRSQAASKEAINSIKQANASILQPILERKGVIVIGYSGWDDAIVEALRKCPSYDHQLFWCGRESDPLEEGAFGPHVKEILVKDTSQYVQITNADSFMLELHKALIDGAPRLLDEPMLQLKEVLEAVNLQEPEKEEKEEKEKLISAVPASFYRLKQSTVERLQNAHEQFFTTGSHSVDETEVEKTHSEIDSLLISAELDQQFGKSDEALEKLQSILKDPKAEPEAQARAYFNLGYIFYTKSDLDSAINSWTKIIEMKDSPTEQVATAFFNRGVAWGQKKETDKEITDYTAVIEMKDAPAEQVAMAYINRGYGWKQNNETDKAIADYTAVIEMKGAPAAPVANAYNNRGVTWGQKKDTDKAIADYTAVIEMKDAPAEQVANAYNNRGVTWEQKNDTDTAIADYTAVIEMKDALAEQVVNAYFNRGTTWGQKNDTDKAIADYTAIIEMKDAPAEQVAMAFFNRGARSGETNKTDKAIADYTAIIQMKDAPAEQVAMAYINRGASWGQKNETDKAITDYIAVIEMKDAPAEQVANAYNNRGVTWGQIKETDKAIADYTAVIEMKDAPAEQVAIAHNNRGVTWGQKKETDKEITDYTAAIEMKDAPAEQVAKAFINRGATWGQKNKMHKAIADYTAVIEMKDAPTEQVAKAFFNRGVTWGQKNETDKAIADYTAIIQMKDAPAEPLANAYFNIACTYALLSELAKSLGALEEWKKLGINVARKKIESDSDFDLIRYEEEFQIFLDTLSD